MLPTDHTPLGPSLNLFQLPLRSQLLLELHSDPALQKRHALKCIKLVK